MGKFEDLLVWKKSKIFVVDIYKAFSVCKDYSYNDQIKRASVSVMNNIAEGCDRDTDKELRRYLIISRASCAEVRSMLYLALELKYLSTKDYASLMFKSKELSKMLSGFIKKL